MIKPPSAPKPVAPPPSLLTLSDVLGARVLAEVDGGDAATLARCRLVCKRLCVLADCGARRLRHHPNLEGLLEAGPVPLTGLLSRWPGLESLEFGASFALSDAHFKEALPAAVRAQLRAVSISHCWGVTHLWPTAGDAPAPAGPEPEPELDAAAEAAAAVEQGGLPSLLTLSAHGCEGLSSLAGLRFSPALTSLDVGACAGITDLSPLTHLVALKSLNLEGCSALNDNSIAIVGGIGSLQSLNVSWCRRLSDLSPLARCTKLLEVVAVGTKLKKDGIAAVRSALGETLQVHTTGGLHQAVKKNPRG